MIEFEIGSSFGSSSTSEAPSVSFPFPVPVSPISVVEDALESNPTPPLSQTFFEFGDPPDDEFLFLCFFFFLTEDGGLISG